jgi:hypothetical protein
MAQQLKPSRLDNRGGKRKKTSSKKMFTYRVEAAHHETLKQIAIYLNSLKHEK